MKKSLSILMVLLLLTASVVALAACGNNAAPSGGSETPAPAATPSDSAPAPADTQQEPINIRFAHEEAPGSYQDLYANKFAEVLKDKVGDAVTVDIYTIGQIGSDQDLVQLLQTGGINMSIASPSTTSTIVPEAQMFDMHFIFSDDMNVNAAVLKESKALNEMLAGKYATQNIQVLAFWTEGYNVWTSNKPLQTAADFNNFKIRTMQSPLLISSYAAYGANPSPMPFSEVYSGLQVKMIDGQENPAYYVKHNNLYEVQDYITNSKHSIYVTATCINPTFFNSLPENIQAAILETVDEIRDYSFEMQQELNDNAISEIVAARPSVQVFELPDEARAEFNTLCQPVRDEFAQMVGEDGKKMLDTLLEEIAAMEAKMQ